MDEVLLTRSQVRRVNSIPDEVTVKLQMLKYDENLQGVPKKMGISVQGSF